MNKKVVIGTALLLGVSALAIWQWPEQASTEDVVVVNPVTPLTPEKPKPQTRVAIMTVSKGGDAHRLALETAHRISDQRVRLSNEEASELLDFIAAKKPEQLKRGQWQHLVNNLLNVLRTKPASVTKERLTAILAEMAEHHHDPVLRLYALQHIARWFADEPDAAKRQQIVTLLGRQAASGSEAGTAVMMLSDLERAGKIPSTEATAKSIEESALALVNKRETAADVRISAIHTLVDRKVLAVLPEARRIADDADETMTLRKAAIFAIGHLGNPAEDQERLTTFTQQNFRIAQAAKPALKRLLK